MNGLHDMGGMHGMGPIESGHEPVFPHPWQARLFALRRAMGAHGRWNIDIMRHEVEQVPAAEHLRLGYFERQCVAFLHILARAGFVTLAELTSGRPDAGTRRSVPALSVDKARRLIAQGVPTSRASGASARFAAGQTVLARTVNPSGHTRLPRYARGKIGVILRDRGVFVFPDTNAHGRGEQPQHVYTVRFEACTLWGEQASAGDAVHLDLWDSYLAPVPTGD